jgi:hypothetical protein
MTGGSTYGPWPDQPDDEYPDFLWPDDEDDQDATWPDEAGQASGDGRGATPGQPVPFSWPVPPMLFSAQRARERRRSLIALTATAVAAAGLGAGAVLVYRNAQADLTPSTTASHHASLAPGHGGAPAGPGSESEMEVLGKVTAVGKSSITIGAGPVQSVRAAVTSATRFTGTVGTLSAVRVGNVVQAQITVTNGTAKLVSLQDPASES